MDLRVPPLDFDAWAQRGNAVTALGHAFVFQSGNDPRRIAAAARLPVLLVGAGLVLAIFFVGRRFFGDGPALVGTALAAFSPDLLAHSGLATEDVVCAAAMFAAVASFERAAHRRRRRDWVLCGVWTGVALLSKYTSLLLGPIYLVLFVWIRRRSGAAAIARDGAAAAAIVGIVAAVIVGAGYNFTFDLGHYVRGFRSLYGDLAGGYHHYLLGRISETPWPHYHVVAFLVKTPLPALLLLTWAIARALPDRKRREAVVVLLVPAIAVFTASFFDRANFGVRRVLPAFPFLFATASVVAMGERRPPALALLVALLAWCGLEAGRTYPHFLSYVNQAAGGPERGPYLLDDSNVDWGQDLPALARWQREHPEAEPLRLSYFGTADPAAYGVQSIAMPREDIANPRPGYYAVSAHRLVYFRKRALLEAIDTDWLTKYEPVDRAGPSIWIYRFE
jgi:4-amino-4-deoxy-L-arabinose transferase-like glycosyltransferase